MLGSSVNMFFFLDSLSFLLAIRKNRTVWNGMLVLFSIVRFLSKKLFLSTAFACSDSVRRFLLSVWACRNIKLHMQLEIPSALSLKQVPCKFSASAFTASCFSAKLCLSYLDHACYNLLILLCFHSNRLPMDRFRRPSNASRRSRMQHSNQITALVCAHVHGNALIQSHWWSLLCKSTLSSACWRMQAYMGM